MYRILIVEDDFDISELLQSWLTEAGYQNAEAFYKAFHKSETAYGDYQDSLKNWKQRYGEKPQSLHDRLISKKQDIKERELTRPYSPPNRGRSR